MKIANVEYLALVVMILTGCASTVPTVSYIKVNPEAVYRLNDTMWFGGSHGLWWARLNASREAVQVLDDIGEVSSLEHSFNRLFIGTNLGVFCIDPENADSIPIAPQVPIRALFRRGGFRLATSMEGDLFSLDTSTNKCENMTTVPIDLGGRKYLRSEYGEDDIWFAACNMNQQDDDSMSSHPICGLYWSHLGDIPPYWRPYTGTLRPPRLVSEFEQIVDMTYVAGSLWVATIDGLYRIKKDSPRTIHREDLVGTSVSRLIVNGSELWVESDSGTWRWSKSSSQFHKVNSLSQISSIFTMDGFSWATSSDGLYQWKSDTDDVPQLIAPGVEEIRGFTIWNGCYWLGAANGLYRLCSEKSSHVQRIDQNIQSVKSIKLAGWDMGNNENARPSSAPEFLWVAGDKGVMRLSTDLPDTPELVDIYARDAHLIVAGDYLWLISQGRIAHWKLDSSQELKLLYVAPMQTLKMCTDNTALWIINSDSLIRVPDVRTNFHLDFDEIIKAQKDKNIYDNLRYEDTRYWNCQDLR